MEVTFELPEGLLPERQPSEVARQVRLYAALMMYRCGELSAGAACELAGLNRYEFLAQCKKHGISSIRYGEDELDSDLDNALGTGGG